MSLPELQHSYAAKVGATLSMIDVGGGVELEVAQAGWVRIGAAQLCHWH